MKLREDLSKRLKKASHSTTYPLDGFPPPFFIDPESIKEWSHFILLKVRVWKIKMSTLDGLDSLEQKTQKGSSTSEKNPTTVNEFKPPENEYRTTPLDSPFYHRYRNV